VPITAGLRLRAPLKVAEVALLGGGGLHVTSLSIDPGSAAGASGVDDTATSFGGYAGASVGVSLSPAMRVGAEVRRTFVGPKVDGERVRVDGLRVALTLAYDF
jgi:hypothetical protein